MSIIAVSLPVAKSLFHTAASGLDISDADGRLSEEVSHAIKFLVSHESELRQLQGFPGVTDLRLDFGYYRREVAVQYDYLPSELLCLAGNLSIGIELSLYPTPTPTPNAADADFEAGRRTPG